HEGGNEKLRAGGKTGVLHHDPGSGVGIHTLRVRFRSEGICEALRNACRCEGRSPGEETGKTASIRRRRRPRLRANQHTGVPDVETVHWFSYRELIIGDCKLRAARYGDSKLNRLAGIEI